MHGTRLAFSWLAFLASTGGCVRGRGVGDAGAAPSAAIPAARAAGAAAGVAVP
ncbi:MAG: hypothetical protein HY907_04900, partial [Deltaproteobacteria bacterium]|nr:hypothetical protein [Deltaproteobacteria bacterium]